jgi:hypothetical protein
MRLIVGAGKLDRAIENAEKKLVEYRDDDGILYLNHQPNTPLDRVVPEDMALTVHVNSVWTLRDLKTSLRSIGNRASSLDLRSLPENTLEQTSPEERQTLAQFIEIAANWKGFAAATATKLLHKKRPELIPMLDNRAIFGAYLNPDWPKSPSRADSIKHAYRIKEALDWIAYDLNRRENREAWPALKAIEPTRSLIQLFDMIWWIHFRSIEDKTGKLIMPVS